MTDPVADMLTRIKNAQIVRKSFVIAPYSKLKWSIADILLKKGFITSLDRVGRQEKKIIKIGIKYNEDKSPYISHLKRISKPSNRQYIKYGEIYYPHGKDSLIIVSTSQGIMSGYEAKKKKMGGEVLLEIW